MELPAVLLELERRGLLLLADNTRPALAQLVAGGPIRGSWWGHPRGKAIFALSSALEAHPDVMVLALVDGKVTFAHRRLWPAIQAVARAREPWQVRGLSPSARTLMVELDAGGALRSDALDLGAGDPRAAVRELETRMLAHVSQVHTDAGTHAKELQGWTSWARCAGVLETLDVAEAKRVLETAVTALPGGGRLPWQVAAL